MQTTATKLLTGLSILALAFTASAAEVVDQVYLNVDAGVAIEKDITSKTTGGKISFDPGVRFGVSGGYRFNESVALELETGLIYNSIDKVGGVPLTVFGQNADWYQVPILANVIYHIPIADKFHAFVGAGAGAVVSTVNIESGPFSMDDSDVTFGYQILAGVTYAINEKMDVGVGYKFLGTADHEFDSFVGLNDSTQTHSLLATFNVRF